MFLARCKQFGKIFFLGDTPKIPLSQLKQEFREWANLQPERRLALIEDIKCTAQGKRNSMGENAHRCNFLLTGLAFIVAASGAVMLATGTSGAAQTVILISAEILLGSTVMLLVTISAKAKVMRRKLSYAPTGIKKRRAALRAQKLEMRRPEMRYWNEYYNALVALHKCEFILLTERRAVWIAATTAAVAVSLLIVGFALR